MKRYFLLWITLLWLIVQGPHVVCAEEPQSAQSTMSQPNASTDTDIEALYQRLERQDEELRQLRDRLEAVQNPSRIVPASAMENADLSQLQQRITSLEQRVDQQSPQQNSANGSADGYEVGTDLRMFGLWRNGLLFESPKKDFRARIGGRLDFDINSFDNDPALLVSPKSGGIGPQPNSIDVRRARIRTEGTMYENFDWIFEMEFAQTLVPAAPAIGQPAANVPTITNANITWTHLPDIGNFSVGNMKEPIGFEHMESARWLDFNERSYLQDAIFGPFNNGFNPGALVYNQWGDKQGTWWAGVFSNNSNPFGYGIGDDWAVTGRLTWLPIYDEPSDGQYLWHLGIAGSVRHPDDGQVRIRDRGDIRSGPPGFLNPIYADTGTMDATLHSYLALETAAQSGPWTMQAEYVGTWVEDAVQMVGTTPVSRGNPFFEGGYVQLMYFLTPGDHRAYDLNHGTFDRITPLEDAFLVDGANGLCSGKGAWQVGVRYNTIDLNDNGINGGVLNSFTFTVNWWLNPNVHVQFNYDLTHRSEVQDVPPGFINAFGTRLAYNF